jgi:hypothetical protein
MQERKNGKIESNVNTSARQKENQKMFICSYTFHLARLDDSTAATQDSRDSSWSGGRERNAARTRIYLLLPSALKSLSVSFPLSQSFSSGTSSLSHPYSVKNAPSSTLAEGYSTKVTWSGKHSHRNTSHLYSDLAI